MNLISHNNTPRVFCPALGDDPQQDELMRKRLLWFGWVRIEHLDIKPHAYNDYFFKNAFTGSEPSLLVFNSIVLVCTELSKLNNYKSPRDKLICILNCCKCIMCT